MSDSKGKDNLPFGNVPKRGPMPDLPNLQVSIEECPSLAKEIKRIRIKRKTLGAFFNHVLGDERND